MLFVGAVSLPRNVNWKWRISLNREGLGPLVEKESFYMRQERIRRERFAPISQDTEDCTHADLYQVAQQEIAEHHTQVACNFYKQQEQDAELHRIARENGANAR